MRILAHIHTFNDADIIDTTIEALLRQTRPVDGILLVDNGSTDGTLDQPSVKKVTVLPHRGNLGASGAVGSGMRFAIEHGYDWIWVFDADNVPEPDALEKLLDLYASWPQSLKDETGFLASLPINVQDGLPLHAGEFTRRAFARVNPGPEERYYACHVTIWSGCLYRLAAVRQIGVPNPDYVLDLGECEYGHRVMKAGYKAFICQDSVLQHNIRGLPSLTQVEVKLGPITLTFFEFPPIRCYYTVRNTFYFALYEAAERRFGMLCTMGLGMVRLTLKFLLRPWNHGGEISACFRGLWHGVTGNIKARY
jgi:GT2 family glycosyltransferase